MTISFSDIAKLIVVTLLFIAGIIIATPQLVVTAQVTPAGVTELEGFAWSAYGTAANPGGIGWISMNCSNTDTCNGGANTPVSDYGVTLEDSGNLTGYAWSSTVGWINFDPVGPFPSGTNVDVDYGGSAQANVAVPNLRLSGWARACSVFENENTCSGALKTNTQRGDWDGWISLGGSVADGSSYGVEFVNGQATDNSFAWGGEVNVGWIDFSPDFSGVMPVRVTVAPAIDIVTIQVPDTLGDMDVDGNYTVTFSPVVQGIPEGETVDWELSVGSFTDSGEVTQTSGVPVFGNTPTINGVPLTITDNLVFEIDTNDDVIETPPGEDNNVFTRPFSLVLPNPSINISGPEIVTSGTEVNIEVRVTAQYDTTCQVFGPGFSASNAEFAVSAGVQYSGNFTSAALANATNIAVRCDVPGGSPFVASLSVDVVPTVQEI